MNLIRKHTTPRARRGAAIIGILFALAVTIGGAIYRTNSLTGLADLTDTPAHALAALATTIAAGAAAAAIALLLAAAQRALRPTPTPAPAPTPRPRILTPTPAQLATPKATLILAAILFAAWLPCLLAYWPGPFSYDIPTQTDYIATGHWTTQQPPLHTLIWSLFLPLEGALGLKALTWMILAQMIFLAAALAHALTFLARRRIATALWLLAAAFFALNPVIALFAITPVKDTLLAGTLILTATLAADLITDPRAFARNRLRVAALATTILACCLLRANMLPAFAAFAIIATIALKEARRTTAAILATPLLLAALIAGPVYTLAGITPGSSAIASVPFQQVANTFRNHEAELTPEEIATIDAIIPTDKIAASYNPRFADTTVRLFRGKSAARTTGAAALRDELTDFAALWLRLAPRYPLDYADAFLALNSPYWYPFAQTPDPCSQRAYIETATWRETPNYPVELDSKLPALRDAYERVADYSALNNPLTGAIFSPASAIWILILATYLLYISGSRRRALLAALPLLFWLTFLIGPVSNMRYLFPIFCLYPLLMCAALQPDRTLPIES